MATYYSPKVTTDGLTLAIDPANEKCLLSRVEVLVVAGGGGGGMDMGGGGGGGGVVYSQSYELSTKSGAITVTVGNGGAGAPAGGTNGQPSSHQFTISATQGQNSVFDNITAIGGGYGASSYYGYTPNSGYGGTGGSGGGCSGYTHGGERYVDSNGTPGQGYPGGNSGNPSSGADDHYSGGGGGAGGRGTSGPNHVSPSGTRANGGPGVRYMSMSPYYFGGGGGGSSYTANEGGNGGLGGGGGGAAGLNGTTVGAGDTNGINPGGNGGLGNYQPGGNGGANTGGGGGGGSHYNSNNKGGDGGSGIVIVKYPGSPKATGGTIVQTGGSTIHTFLSSGTFTPNTTFNDLSSNNNNATINTFTYNSLGGGSLYNNTTSNGTSGIVVSLSTFSKLTGTIEVWAYPNSWNDSNGLFINRSDSTANAGDWLWFGVWNSGTTLYFRLGNSSTCCDMDLTVGSWSSIHPTGRWGQYVCTWLSGVESNIYFNGELKATRSITAIPNTNPSATGQIGVGHGSGNSMWLGYLSSFKTYNRMLTSQEVLNNFNANRKRFGI